MSDKEKVFWEILMRQFEMSEYVTTADMARKSRLSAPTVRRYMAKLCDLGFLYSEGKNKGNR